jgi:ADP-ribose pyrophosphatase YjhB (NUDIX family)
LTLSRFGLSPFFSDVASGSPKGSVKTVCIREIVDRWGFRPEDVVYVGDAPTDIEAAKEAGVRMIAVTWCPEADAATLTALNPDAVVESVEELRALLCRHDTTRTVRLGQRVQALAQTGLTFSKDRYDIDRYEALSDIAAQLMAYSPPSPGREELVTAFKNQLGYATPKVDVRGIVLRNGKVLLVREAEDGLWSLPGGWADVGDRPSGAISREIGEETGLDVRVDRLLGIWDRNLHDHPPYPFHVYKMIFLCTEQGGEIRLSAESLELDFFDPSQLPPLSVSRVVPLEIQTSIEIAERHMPAYFD